MISINMKSTLLLATLLLSSLITSANAFSIGRLAQSLVINVHPSVAQSSSTTSPQQGMVESSVPCRSLSTRQLIEEDFSTQQIGQGFGITAKAMSLVQSVSKRFDTSKMADKGVSFVLSYALVSNLNGAVSLSLAWYIACLRTGLCPLVPGQWKTLLSAYGGLYAVITLLRPLRVMAAVALSKYTETWLQQIQEGLGCSRRVAVTVKASMGVVAWLGLAAAGISMASLCSGVPLW